MLDSSAAESRNTWSVLEIRRGLLLSIAIIGLSASAWTITKFESAKHASSSSETELDQRLQRAAEAALGDQRGTIIVLDPQTGRVRAIVNPEVAFQQSFPPGSTLKPFTALAALRAQLISENDRTLCHEKFSHGDFHTTCAHPRDLAPFDPTEAIAYSCNYYFGKLGERLPETNLEATLNQFGFGKDVGGNQSNGKIVRAAWTPQSAMGEGEFLTTSPAQLLSAYTTLVNGGRLYAPLSSTSAWPLQRTIDIESDKREIILKGMRGAVRYGTAEAANLYALPLYVFGKTGTATEINGYHTHGWFAGFAASVDEKDGGAVPSPEKIQLAVLVFLYHAHGVDAAQLARPIFNEFVRAEPSENVATVATSRTDEKLPASVRVFVARENSVRTLSIEDYVRGVVAAEGSTETESEALKALAIASRTYVLKNIGRHQPDGYDFCTTTHCQRFSSTAADNVDVPQRIADAVSETSGEVLRDADNALVDSYFSASCGGATANIATLWGKTAPPYLRGVDDEYCESGPHHDWKDVIPADKLSQALQTDPRTNVGPQLRNVAVVSRDETGRAQTISVQGEKQLTVSGWDFKIVVGRALGWNMLKSSRFEISRSGSNFVFRGSGFGHGLGLCQEGAHVMAERGANYRQILRKYFPSTHLAEQKTADDLLWNGTTPFAPAARFETAGRRTLSSENFRINYPSSTNRRDVENLMTLLVNVRRSLNDRLNSVGATFSFATIEIFVNDTTGDFVGRTGQPAWAAAATRKGRIELQPLSLLTRKRILESTIRHELAHIAIDSVSGERAPRWLSEGLAIHLAGEGNLVERFAAKRDLSSNDIERSIETARDSSEMRTAYAAAYVEVKRLIQAEGEKSVWQRLAK